MPPTTTALTLPTAPDFRPDAPREPDPRASLLGLAAACWGISGQVALLLVPARKLAHAGVNELLAQRAAWTLPVAAGTVAVFCFLMGYRGMQRGYAPLVAARAAHLARHPRVWHAVLAPLHVCGLVHATRRRQATRMMLLVGMPAAAATAGLLPQPLRALVAVGVAFALLWGIVAVVVFSIRAAAGRAPAVALDLPCA